MRYARKLDNYVFNIFVILIFVYDMYVCLKICQALYVSFHEYKCIRQNNVNIENYIFHIARKLGYFLKNFYDEIFETFKFIAKPSEISDFLFVFRAIPRKKRSDMIFF